MKHLLGGGDTPFVKPNVSLCIEENEVHYNPWSWADEYLTFVALEDGKFGTDYGGLKYSLNNGKTWYELRMEYYTDTVTAGNKIMWKGHFGGSLYNLFKSTGKFDVQGNVMSLLYGDDFKGQTDLSGYDNAIFISLFKGTQVVNAKNLSLPATTLGRACYNSMFAGCTSLVTAPKLPATTLTDSCYFGMFEGCTSLVTAPELPATTLADGCYKAMFRSCTSLNYIKAMFTTTPDNNYTHDWVKGVASTGTFIKNSAATWDVTGDSGIPSGWTVVTE